MDKNIVSPFLTHSVIINFFWFLYHSVNSVINHGVLTFTVIATRELHLYINMYFKIFVELAVRQNHYFYSLLNTWTTFVCAFLTI